MKTITSKTQRHFIVLPLLLLSALLIAGCISHYTANWKTQFKVAQVEHFTQADGVGIPQDFVDGFYDGLRENVQQFKIAEQVVDQGATVSDADAANAVVIEGKFTSLKKGGFITPNVIEMEVKLYRKSDHTLLKTIPVEGAFNGMWQLYQKTGKLTGGNAAASIGKALN